MSSKTIIIVGGGAAGASCATRLRRLDERARIIIIERGSHVSFAHCGLPYYVGTVIKREKLFVVEPDMFMTRFDIDLRTGHDVISINRDKKEISIKIIGTHDTYTEKYDSLVLACGSAPALPPIPGIGIPGIFSVRSIHDADDIIAWIEKSEAKSAAVIGSGFIGLEMSESLRSREMRVTLVEMLPRVAPFLDPEMAVFLEDHLETHGVELLLADEVVSFGTSANGKIRTSLKSGNDISTDIVILALGVKPETGLAQKAGLEIGESGGIKTDDVMRTSDVDIYAAGDCAEILDAVIPSGARIVVRLAGPAQRQGRVAADTIAGTGARKRTFRGSQRTAVCGVFNMTLASTGVNETHLKRLNKKSGKSRKSRSSDGPAVDYEKVYLSPLSSEDYFPGGSSLFIKLLFSKKDGRILGAQALGMKGVEKRIDVIAMAIQNNGTVFDLEEAELCYAPQYGSARDPVNLAGMIAANSLRILYGIAHWEDLPGADVFVLDVRTNDEFESGHVPGAMNIPLHALRKEIDAVPREKEIWVYCERGQRSYNAARILSQNGFYVRNISGGYVMYEALKRLKI